MEAHSQACPPQGEPPDGEKFRLSLILPAWNEAAVITRAINEAAKALAAVSREYEIIVVDDGSTDETAELTRAAACKNPRVRLISHATNRGYGAALRSGFAAARLELVAFTDADCQFDLSELDYMLPLTKRYDIVCGTRIDRQDPPLRLFYSWGYNTLVRALLGSPVHDLDCALKIFRRDRLDTILPQCDNFFANTEMLVEARMQGLSVVEVGVHHRARAGGQSKVSLAAVPRTLKTLLPFWWTRVMFPGERAAAAAGGRWFWLGMLLLALLSGVQLFSNLHYPLIEPDEGRYAEISREMVASGDWVVPTLHHEPYLDKPPLLYWLVAASYECFGMSDQSARLAPAIASLLTILATAFFAGRAFGPRGGLLSGFVLALSMGFIHAGRFIILDSLLSMWIALAMLTAYEAVSSSRLYWRWWLLSALLCGLGVMTKGPVAVALVLPPVVAYCWLSKLPGRPRVRHWLVYLFVAGAMVVPWFLAIHTRVPGFLRHFLWEHHVNRFVGGLNHAQPFWFYLPILLAVMTPWTILLWPALRFQFSRDASIARLRSLPGGFFLLWASWCLLFFSAATCKLLPYIFPAVPAIAVLLGVFFERLLYERALAIPFARIRRLAPQVSLVVLSFCWAGVVWGAWAMNPEQRDLPILQTLVGVGLMAFVFRCGNMAPAPLQWGLASALTLAVTLQVGGRIVPDFSVWRAPLPQSAEIARLLADKDTTVALWWRECGSVPFYLGRNDVKKIGDGGLDKVTEFLGKHQRTVIVHRSSPDVEALRGAVPRGMEISKLGSTAGATIWLIEPIPLMARRGEK